MGLFKIFYFEADSLLNLYLAQAELGLVILLTQPPRLMELQTFTTMAS